MAHSARRHVQSVALCMQIDDCYLNKLFTKTDIKNCIDCIVVVRPPIELIFVSSIAIAPAWLGAQEGNKYSTHDTHAKVSIVEHLFFGDLAAMSV